MSLFKKIEDKFAPKLGEKFRNNINSYLRKKGIDSEVFDNIIYLKGLNFDEIIVYQKSDKTAHYDSFSYSVWVEIFANINLDIRGFRKFKNTDQFFFKANTKIETKGLIRKKITGIHWVGAKIADYLNDDKNLTNLLIDMNKADFLDIDISTSFSYHSYIVISIRKKFYKFSEFLYSYIDIINKISDNIIKCLHD